MGAVICAKLPNRMAPLLENSLASIAAPGWIVSDDASLTP